MLTALLGDMTVRLATVNGWTWSWMCLYLTWLCQEFPRIAGS